MTALLQAWPTVYTASSVPIITLQHCHAVIYVHVNSKECIWIEQTLFYAPLPKTLKRFLNIHTIYIQYTYNIHTISIQYTYNIHTIYIQYTYNTHTIYIQYTYNIHTIYIQYTYNIHTIYIQYTYNTHIQYTYNTHTIHIQYTYNTIHIQYTYNTHTIHIQYTYNIHIIHRVSQKREKSGTLLKTLSFVTELDKWLVDPNKFSALYHIQVPIYDENMHFCQKNGQKFFYHKPFPMYFCPKIRFPVPK